MIIACAGCHLHWLALFLLPIALWVFKIFRHKGKKCPCGCHEKPKKRYLTEGYQPKGNIPVTEEVPSFQQGYKPTIITEGNTYITVRRKNLEDEIEKLYESCPP